MISYTLTGSFTNPVVLFLHGFLGNSHEWDDLIKNMADFYYCLAIDLPGHGRTGIGRHNNSLLKACQEILDLLDELEIKKCHILSYSMGGRFAIHLLDLMPKRFLSCILESSCPGIKEEKKQEERIKNDEYIAREIEKKAKNFENYLLKWYQQPFFKMLKTDKKLFKKIMEIRLQNDPHSVAKALRAYGMGRKLLLWNTLKNITCPVLLICGSLDKKFVRISRDIALELSLVHMVILSDCGHNVHMEQAQKYRDIVFNFLKNEF